MDMKKKLSVLLALALAALGTAGCMQNRDPSVNWQLSDSMANLPKLPQRLEIGGDGVPTLSVYDVSRKKTTDMDIES